MNYESMVSFSSAVGVVAAIDPHYNHPRRLKVVVHRARNRLIVKHRQALRLVDQRKQLLLICQLTEVCPFFATLSRQKRTASRQKRMEKVDETSEVRTNRRQHPKQRCFLKRLRDIPFCDHQPKH